MEKLKSSLGFLFGIVKGLDDALEDGKINIFTEGIPLTMKLVEVPTFIQNIKEIKPDLEEIISDDIKRAEIVNYFTSNFELSSDKAEKVTEALFKALLRVADAFEDVISAIKSK